MNREMYQWIIGILIVIITSLVWVLLHQQPVTITEVQYEQTPFQWQCKEQVKQNCSTVYNFTPPEVIELQKENIVYLSDGDTLDPTLPETPDVTPTGTPLATPEFPFLGHHQ